MVAVELIISKTVIPVFKRILFTVLTKEIHTNQSFSSKKDLFWLLSLEYSLGQEAKNRALVLRWLLLLCESLE